MLEHLTTAQVSGWFTSLRPTKVAVALPRFRLSSTLALHETMRRAGLELPFTEGADFSGLGRVDREHFFISQVIQQAVVKVDEQGAEAVAATAVSIAGTKSVERGPPVFRTDHPFAFFIRDGDTDVVLFAGKVHRPEGCAGESTRGTTPQVVFGLAKGGNDARVASLASAGVEILTPSPRPPAAGWPSSRTTTATCCRSTRRASCLAEGPHALPRFRFAAAREFL